MVHRVLVVRKKALNDLFHNLASKLRVHLLAACPHEGKARHPVQEVSLRTKANPMKNGISGISFMCPSPCKKKRSKIILFIIKMFHMALL